MEILNNIESLSLKEYSISYALTGSMFFRETTVYALDKEDAINKLFEQLKNIPKEQICYEEPIRVMEMECPSNMTCDICPYADDCYE